MHSEQPIRFDAGGLGWTARRDFRAGVEELCRHLADPDALPGSVRIKASMVRTVWRMSLAGQTVYVKRYHVRGRRERLKYLFATPRARAEWRAAGALAAAGIEAAPPLAMALRRDGPWLADAFFVAAQVPGAPYAEALAELRRRGEDPTPLLRETVALCERLEAAGIVHPDLHGGNLLVRADPGAPRIGLVDLHAVKLRGGGRRRARMRAKLAHSLWRLFGADEFDTVLRLLAPGSEERLRARVARLERVRLRSRSKRCVRRSTGFTCERADGWTIWRRREVSREELLALSGGTGGTDPARPAEIRVAGEARRVRVERWRGRSGMRRWQGLHALRVREIPAPTAYAFLQRTVFGFAREALLVSEHLPGAVPLERVAPEGRGPALAEAAESTAARLHRSGLSARLRDLVAVPDASGWRVLCGSLEGRVPDRPLTEECARGQRERLRACSEAQPLSATASR